MTATPSLHHRRQHIEKALGPQHRRLRVLLSFYYNAEPMAQVIPARFEPPYPEIFADSGGYSADSVGATIRVQDYAEWLHTNKDWLAAYANLDSIRDVDETLRNQQYLEDQGLYPIPVFHVGEPWSVLEDLIEDYPYIALGGIVSNRQAGFPALARFMVRAFRMAEGLSVYHGFGMTAWEMLKALPWYTVDSTTWQVGHRYNEVPLFNTRLGRIERLKTGDKPKWRRLGYLASQFGYSIGRFSVKGVATPDEISGVSILSWMQMEQWLRRRHGTIALHRRGKWRDYTVPAVGSNGHPADNGTGEQPPAEGLRIYLAGGTVPFWSKMQSELELVDRRAA